MSEKKRTISTVVYTMLVFIISSGIAFSLLAPDAMQDAGEGQPVKVGLGGFIALGLSVALTVMFYNWYSKRNKSKRSV